jgi:nucleolar GTP-binding protein
MLNYDAENYHLANDEWKSDIIPEIMDGKNIADFVDPDIAEKLDALEREEEMLEAEGFYEDHEDMVSFPCLRKLRRASNGLIKYICWQVDSDDEREAAAAKIALGHKMEAQRKKKIKNKARLPRTAGLRTLSDLTTDLTKAGIDPSRVQERAVMIAKIRAAGHKRKRDEDGMDVDGNGVDEDGDNWVSEGDGEDETMMDVDGDEGEKDGTQHKRGKANSGAAIAHRKRVPRSNRQLAGMRDEAVRCCYTQHHPLSPRPPFPFPKGADDISFFFLSCSKYPKRHDYGILDNAGATCLRKRARATALSESKWCVCVCFLIWKFHSGSPSLLSVSALSVIFFSLFHLSTPT